MAAKKDRSPKELGYFEAMVIVNDFIDNEMPKLKPAEVKLGLVILRKTIGWHKYSEWIGAKELRQRANVDKDTVKDTVPTLCKKVGVKIEQRRHESGDLERRKFTWPTNDRVRKTLVEAEANRVGGKLPPTPGGEITPEGEGQNPPTQYSHIQSSPQNRPSVEELRERLRMVRERGVRGM